MTNVFFLDIKHHHAFTKKTCFKFPKYCVDLCDVCVVFNANRSVILHTYFETNNLNILSKVQLSVVKLLFAKYRIAAADWSSVPVMLNFAHVHNYSWHDMTYFVSHVVTCCTSLQVPKLLSSRSWRLLMATQSHLMTSYSTKTWRLSVKFIIT